MKKNIRIKGARGIIYNNIEFRSLLECSCYKKLELSGLNFSYESERIILWEGVKLSKVKLYAPKKLGIGKYSKILEEQKRALLNMTYTPDFIIIKGNYKIYFDVKGKENDTYPIKKKLFLKVLENRQDEYTYLFFEPHNVGQMMQALDIISKL